MGVNNLRSRIVCLQAVSLHFIEDDLLIKEAVNTSSTDFFIIKVSLRNSNKLLEIVKSFKGTGYNFRGDKTAKSLKIDPI